MGVVLLLVGVPGPPPPEVVPDALDAPVLSNNWTRLYLLGCSLTDLACVGVLQDVC